MSDVYIESGVSIQLTSLKRRECCGAYLFSRSTVGLHIQYRSSFISSFQVLCKRNAHQISFRNFDSASPSSGSSTYCSAGSISIPVLNRPRPNMTDALTRGSWFIMLSSRHTFPSAQYFRCTHVVSGTLRTEWPRIRLQVTTFSPSCLAREGGMRLTFSPVLCMI